MYEYIENRKNMLVNIRPLINYIFWRVKPQWKLGKFLKYPKPCTSVVKVWRLPAHFLFNFIFLHHWRLGKWLMAELTSEVVTNSDKLHKSQLWLQIKYQLPHVHRAQKPSHKSLQSSSYHTVITISSSILQYEGQQ